MNATDIDRLARTLAAPTTRRAMGRLLTALPLAATLVVRLDEATTAARRQKRRQRTGRHDQLHDQRKKKRKKCAKAGRTPKKGKRCCQGLVRDGSGRCAQFASDCIPATCGPTSCGSVPDGCGGTLSCGGCAGTTICVSGACQPCDVCPSGCPFSAVQAAVAAAVPGATIRLCAGTYAGDISITKDLTLIGAGDGAGAGNTILDGLGADSVVTITASPTVSLQRLRLTGGNANLGGGGIRNFGTLTLTHCTVSGNTAGISGGGILNGIGATVTLTGCTITSNTADFGGGIRNDGTAQLVNSEVTDNTASDSGGGIFNNNLASLTLDAASRVTSNHADPLDSDSGGGIYNDTDGTVTLSSSANVTGNTPHNCGGDPVPLCVD